VPDEISTSFSNLSILPGSSRQLIPDLVAIMGPRLLRGGGKESRQSPVARTRLPPQGGRGSAGALRQRLHRCHAGKAEAAMDQYWVLLATHDQGGGRLGF
jgi:hypothetical protein